MNILEKDRTRYVGEKYKIPLFHKYFRKVQTSKSQILRLYYKMLFAYAKRKQFIELSAKTQIGEGLYFGHPYCITINPQTIIGKNCNIHKCVTIGRENRGKRKGTPIIGDYVWIGIGAVIVGNIHIGNDVMIVANSFVNCDVPDHSIVIGNPCKIIHKDNATYEYIKNAIKTEDEILQ